MPVNFHDLPPDVQKQLRARGVVAPAKPRRPKDRRTVTDPTGSSSWRCCKCPASFTVYALAEDHARESGHARIELVLPETTPNA